MIIYPILLFAAVGPIIAFGAGQAFENAEHRTGLIWLGVGTLTSIAATLAMAAAHAGSAS